LACLAAADEQVVAMAEQVTPYVCPHELVRLIVEYALESEAEFGLRVAPLMGASLGTLHD
jgi:hypothetical protein